LENAYTSVTPAKAGVQCLLHTKSNSKDTGSYFWHAVPAIIHSVRLANNKASAGPRSSGLNGFRHRAEKQVTDEKGDARLAGNGREAHRIDRRSDKQDQNAGRTPGCFAFCQNDKKGRGPAAPNAIHWSAHARGGPRTYS